MTAPRIGDQPPDDTPLPAFPARLPSRSHLLELLTLCAEFLATASADVHTELRQFLTAQGYHHRTALPAFLDQLALTTTPPTNEPAAHGPNLVGGEPVSTRPAQP